ncbi:MAG: zinc-ribbon domain-containing protein, partial [Planctomycetota bacterium]
MEQGPARPPRPATGPPCPSCGKRVPVGSTVCTVCGTDLRTGRSLLTQEFGWRGFQHRLRHAAKVVIPPVALVAIGLAAAWYFGALKGVFEGDSEGPASEGPASEESAPEEKP